MNSHVHIQPRPLHFNRFANWILMGGGGGWPLGGPRTLVRSVIEKQVLLKLQSRLCGFQHQTGGCGVAGEGVRAFSAGAASGNSRARLRLRLRPSQPSSYSAHRQLLDSSPVWSKCKQTQITQSIVIVLLLLVVVVDVKESSLWDRDRPLRF